jgi:hypothetical protein
MREPFAMEGSQRREVAKRASVAVACRLGVTCDEPIVLKDSNNTIVHLAPAPIVAKVATTTIRDRDARLLERELSVGRYLSVRGAPIAAPTSSVPPGPHRHGATLLTLWELHDHDPDRAIDLPLLAAALKGLHDAFLDYPGELPDYIDQLKRAGDVISHESRTSLLKPDDRAFLQGVQQRLLHDVQSLDIESQPLHGDPHLDGNVLRTPSGPVFIDFEAACIGPKEWDLTALPKDVAEHYLLVDFDLLERLRLARSLCVAAWCWMQPGRAPEVDEAAQFHLAHLRSAMSRP